MKILSLSIATVALGMTSGLAHADRVGGSPKANFSTNELTIPCVQVTALNEQTEGLFYDIVLERRGNSYNYELTAVEAEDPALCQRIADFAAFEDDDYDDENDPDDEPGTPDILAMCEVRAERSSISVQGKDLEDGDYYAVVTSGEASAQSMLKAASDGEVEYDFDSNADEVLAGAEEVATDFIVDNAVTASIFADGADEALVVATATCLTVE